jgi:predicted enzyme related to lactoylglutathione lyase
MSNAEVLGKFVWHELMTSDATAAAAFYPKVLPWRTAPSNMPGYTIWMAGQTQIGGLMAQPAEEGSAQPHWLVYIGTPNVDTTCTQAQTLGAKLCKAASDIPNVGRYAVLADPQGATFAVFSPAGGPPPGPQPAQGGFSWHELQTTDVAAALRFYSELFGWRKGPAHDMGAMGVYQLFEHGASQVGGMCRPGAVSAAPSWLSYVHVADANRAVAAAKAGGGRLLHGPMEVPGGTWIALMMDPQGGSFAVQEAARTTSQPKAPPPVAKAAPTPPTLKAAAPAKPAPAPKAAPAPAAKPLVAAAAPNQARKAAKKAANKSAKKAGRKTAKKAAKRAAKKVAKKSARKPARKAAKKAAGRKAARKTRKPARKSSRARRR